MTESEWQVAAREMAERRGGRFGVKVWGYYRYEVSDVILNEKFMADLPKLRFGLITSEKSGFHPPRCNTIKSIVDHELGHAIDYKYGIGRDRRLGEEVDRARQLPGGVRVNVSTYATTNDREFLAESWAEYLNNPQPRETALRVGRLIETIARGEK